MNEHKELAGRLRADRDAMLKAAGEGNSLLAPAIANLTEAINLLERLSPPEGVLTRYTPWLESDPDIVGMTPDPEGEWVRYEDHAAALATKEAEIAALKEALAPFNFGGSPSAFLGEEGAVTEALICDEDVQRVRAIVSRAALNDQPAGEG